MLHSICLIDDSIPLGDEKLFIDDRGRLNSSNIELLLNNEEIEWSEPPVKELLIKLLEDKEIWSVSAFKNPDIYLNNFDKEYYFPDLIIFDWDYGGTTTSTEELLKIIVEKSFSLISIYTRSDEQETVERIIESSFKEYENRIKLTIKSDEDSPQKLIDIASQRLKDNFAFKFSKELRVFNRDSLESILIEFGKPNINDIVWLFGDEEKENNKISLNAKEISEMIAEKLRAELISKKFGNELESINSNYNPTCEEKIVKKMWSFRLYYKPQDNLVRKGDLIYKESDGKDTMYLVISSDCHLKTFWKKNFGYLTVVPLHKICKNNDDLITKLKWAASVSDLKKITATSLVNLSGRIDGPTILPCIPSSTNYDDYFLFPKEIISVKIPVPESKKDNPRTLQLDYSFISGFISDDRITVSEQFITPLVEHILHNISGYGAQDYPKGLQTSITKNIDEMFK